MFLAVDERSGNSEGDCRLSRPYDFRIRPSPTGRDEAVLAHEAVDLVVLDLRLMAEDGMALDGRATNRRSGSSCSPAAAKGKTG